MKKSLRYLITFLFFIFPFWISAAYFSFLPQTLTQPDGTIINCFASGDEFVNWYHDADGYSIIQGSDAYYYYAIQNGDYAKPSVYRVNSVNPATVGLSKWVKLSKNIYDQKRKAFYQLPKKSSKAPHSGTLNNITVFIKFSDQTEFVSHRSVFNNRFNQSPGTSLKSYYAEASYNNLNISTTHYPTCANDTNISYVDANPRAYYLPYDANTNPIGYQNDRTEREHTLLANAINAISSQVDPGLNLDGDGDGFVDNVCFIIRGGNSAWADLLWAHRWWLSTQTVYINGFQVSDYTFQPESQNDVQTICHEMFHALGAPDLYHYSYDGFSPAGNWDLMESGFGHMGAFMKWKYSGNTWISSIPEITSSGTYTLHPLTSSTNNCYKIASPNSPNEYFILEYRRKVSGTFENSLPGSGLLVYRINENVGEGNANGPPDEVYIYRPGGTESTNGNISTAYFSANVGRTYINNFSNPGTFLTDGSVGDLNIFDITSADSTISFTIGFNSKPVANFSASRTVVLQGETIDFTDNSLGNPTSWQWSLPGSNTPTTATHNPTSVSYANLGYYNVTMKAINAFGSDTAFKTTYIRVVSNILDCSGAVNLSCGVPYDGNTTFNGVCNVNQYSCTNNNFYGPEVLHSITISEQSNIQATLSNISGTLYVIIADSCNAQRCVDYNHFIANYYNAPAGTHYIIVDGYKGVEGSYRLTVTCTPSIGIRDVESNNTFSIYPNPASDQITITNNSQTNILNNISIFNVLGEKVLEQNSLTLKSSTEISLNIRELNAGIYFVRLQGINETGVVKFLKE